MKAPTVQAQKRRCEHAKEINLFVNLRPTVDNTSVLCSTFSMLMVDLLFFPSSYKVVLLFKLEGNVFVTKKKVYHVSHQILAWQW